MLGNAARYEVGSSDRASFEGIAGCQPLRPTGKQPEVDPTPNWQCLLPVPPNTPCVASAKPNYQLTSIKSEKGWRITLKSFIARPVASERGVRVFPPLQGFKR